jgi:hypothetical protein
MAAQVSCQPHGEPSAVDLASATVCIVTAIGLLVLRRNVDRLIEPV